MPGCWEDLDGVHHFEVEYLHRLVERQSGIPVLDTPAEVDETIEFMTATLRQLAGPDAKFVIHRPANEIKIAK